MRASHTILKSFSSGLALVLLVTVQGTAASENFSKREDLYYNLSDDPNSLQLLDLSNIGSENGREYLNIIDLFRGEANEGMINTWEIDCGGERMGIVQTMHLTPDGSDAALSIDGEVISSRSSQASWTISTLVCEGKGNLEKRRVCNGPLDQIISRFWGL